MVVKFSKMDVETAALGFKLLLDFYRLHVAIDLVVLNAYGWQDLDLEHDFQEVETLLENDRVRYIISTAVLCELLKRLLAENHARTISEGKSLAPTPKRRRGKRKASTYNLSLFEREP